MRLLSVFLIIAILSSCGIVSVKYSASGVALSPDVKTVSIQYFPNQAPLVEASLSRNFTESLKDKFQSQTSLALINGIGDLNFEGEIVDYFAGPQAISGNEQVTTNRLTITIRVKFTNAKEPKWNFDQKFTRYEDFSSNQDLSAVEKDLNEKILKELVNDIFVKSVANW
jgi:hypothetical protein